MFIFIAVPTLPELAANILMIVTGFFLALSFILYIPVFAGMYKHSSKPQSDKA